MKKARIKATGFTALALPSTSEGRWMLQMDDCSHPHSIGWHAYNEDEIELYDTKSQVVIHTSRTIEIPDGATHYFGDINDPDDITFAKMTMVGVAGSHWWSWNAKSGEWKLCAHYKPHWLRKLSPVMYGNPPYDDEGAGESIPGDYIP